MMSNNYNPFTLVGKTILVTGASSGIGRSIAIECSKAGAIIIITGRDTTRLNETYGLLLGTENKIIVSDLTKPSDFDYLIKGLPILNGIVHCAGIIKRVPIKFIKEENLEQVMRINFFAPALLTQKIIKNRLIKNEGSIVFISSVASSFASIGNILYMSSKGAMNSFVKGIALELSSSGIRANAIQPGMIKTNLTKAISDEELERDISKYPLGRYGNREEIAYTAIFLLSDATKWMTGSIITIDGGLTLK